MKHAVPPVILTELRECLSDRLVCRSCDRLELKKQDRLTLGHCKVRLSWRHIEEDLRTSAGFQSGLDWPYERIMPAVNRNFARRRIGDRTSLRASSLRCAALGRG